MIIPKGNSDPNFDPDAVPEEAKRRTLVRSAAVWGVLASIAAVVGSSGKTLSLDNAPGQAEQAAKNAASKKAYLDEVKALEEKRKAKGRGARSPE